MHALELSERVAAANAASTANLPAPDADILLERIRTVRASYQAADGAPAREWMHDADRLLGELEVRLSVNRE